MTEIGTEIRIYPKHRHLRRDITNTAALGADRPFMNPYLLFDHISYPSDRMYQLALELFIDL